MTSAEYLKELKKERNVLRGSLLLTRDQAEKFEIRQQIASITRRIDHIQDLINGEPQIPERHIMKNIETPERSAYKG